ncbi:phospho-sugar mutase [Brevibacillus sp. SYP-B805]|nr:phospho-sugar mutase [Brevibacillus sp. SYP-B805]
MLPALREELLALTDETEIEDRFYTHLQFGTAGLRGIIGAGTNRINLYTIRRATHGFARYLLRQDEANKAKGVAIAYDSRHHSADFAREAAGALACCGIKVYLFEEMRPTPMLSFAVRHLGAAGGIVITASHNPPEYNGYKVYNEHGGQIAEAAAEEIWQEISAITDELALPTLPVEEGLRQGLIQLIGEEIDQAYQSRLSALLLNREAVRQAGDRLRIVYTPLHGTGLVPVERALRESGLTNLAIVREQAVPDPDFSTVSSPNPEEPQAFALAIRQAAEREADLILGTDPDADRLGVAVRDARGEYPMLTGNQLGALLLHYLLEQRQAQGKLPKNGIAIKTIVSSELGRAVADAYGIRMAETLTGFKYIAEKIAEYERSGTFTFLFGYEESYGYLIGDFVRDKDAVQAAQLTAEMAAAYKANGMSLLDALERLQARFGYYTDLQHAFTCKGKEGVEMIKRVMQALRNTPLSEIAGLTVQAIKDYLHSIDGLPPSNVLKYILSDGSWFALRPSGTEPKMKLYISTVDATAERSRQKAEALKSVLVTYLQYHMR